MNILTGRQACRAAISALVLAGSVCLAGSAAAQGAQPGPAAAGPSEEDSAKPGMTVSIGGEATITDKQQLKDRKVVLDALKDMSRGGYPAVKPHLKALAAVLDHAPPSYPKVEFTEDGAVFRANPGEGAAEMTMVGIMAAARGKASTAVRSTINIYPMASMLLGGYAVENHNSDEAIAYLDKGLALQPNSAQLLAEKGAALQQAGKPQEALAVYDSGLKDDDFFNRPNKLDRARLLRGRGYSLGELGRLDEAEAAYRQSLQEEPGNELAQGELRYLAQVRAGRPPTPGQVLLPQPAPDRTSQP